MPEGTPKFALRRSEHGDLASIQSLVDTVTENRFGSQEISMLIERTVLSITVSDENGEVVGFASFDDTPRKDKPEWEDWLLTQYNCPSVTPFNTTFLRYVAVRRSLEVDIMREVLRTVFGTLPDVDNCLTMIPSFEVGRLSDLFTAVRTKDRTSKGSTTQLLMATRLAYLPNLTIRAARVEDHDDLVPIFNRQSEVLTERYGEFFLAELIEAQSETNKAIVAEVDGRAVGFLSISTNISVPFLTTNFDLEPFDNFRKTIRRKIKRERKASVVNNDASKEEDSLASSHGGSNVALNAAGLVGSAAVAARDTPPSSAGSTTERTAPQLSIPSAAAVATAAVAEDQKPPSSPMKAEGGSASGGPSGRALLNATPGKAGLRGLVKRNSLTGGMKEPAQADGDAAAGGPALAAGASATPQPQGEEKALSGFAEKVMQMQGKPMLSRRCSSVRAIGSLVARSRSRGSIFGSQKELDALVQPILSNEEELGPEETINSCFCIYLFCVDERYESRSVDFLQAAFNAFPYHDYCVLAMPPTMPEFPLLRRFLRVLSKPGISVSQELFLCHRHSLLTNIGVRAVHPRDLPSIGRMCEAMEDGGSTIIDDVEIALDTKQDPDGVGVYAFVMTCAEQIVAVSVVRSMTVTNASELRGMYNLEDFIVFAGHGDDEHVSLHHFVVNPIFTYRSRHFAREILRQLSKSCMYYRVYPNPSAGVGGPTKSQTMTALIEEMVQVRPRRQICYPEGVRNMPAKPAPHAPFALSFLCKKMIYEPKLTVNARIVVIGASDVGLSYLASLVYQPHLRFGNLMLISPHGFPAEMAPDAARERFLSSCHCFTRDDHHRLALPTMVSSVSATMKGIDRENGLVHLENGQQVPYDYLVLATGAQLRLQGQLNIPARRVPRNVVCINDDADAQAFLELLETIRPIVRERRGGDWKIIVYGASIDAFCAVEGLLFSGIPGESIVLVKPALSSSTDTFGRIDDEQALQRITAEMKREGVTIHEAGILSGFEPGKDSGEVTGIQLKLAGRRDAVVVPCKAVVLASTRAVDQEVFRAVNDACLVFDGRLVVDAGFATNDRRIFSAGALAKYARRYHAPHMNMALHNSRELGEALAVEMLALFDPLADKVVHEDNLLPLFLQPKLFGGIMPGGLSFLSMQPPPSVDADPNEGRSVSTNHRDNYFQIKIDRYDCIESLACLTKGPLEVGNLACLYGLPQTYANRLMARFDEGLVKDLFAFFRQAWAMSLFHDRFDVFRKEVLEGTASHHHSKALQALIAGWLRESPSTDLTSANRSTIVDSFTNSDARKVVEKKLFEFLEFNSYHLPMYYRPGTPLGGQS
eukprot:Opistho-2@21151